MFNSTKSMFSVVAFGGVLAAGPAIGGVLETCIADINQDTFQGDPAGDGVVDAADFGLLLGQYGDTGVGLIADIDGDNVVGQSDLAFLLTYFGAAGPACENIAGPGEVVHTATRVDNSLVRVGEGPFDPLFDGGVTHYTFEISVDLGGVNIWTTGSMDTTILPGSPFEIYQHPFGGDATTEFPGVSAVQYDTAVQSAYGLGTTGVLFDGVIATPKEFDVDVWFTKGSPSPNGGLIARVSLVRTGAAPDPVMVPFGACPGAVRIGTVEISSTAGFTEGQLHTDVFEIIENPLVSDINGDLTVDTADLGILIANFGTDHPYSDVNNDEIVNTADLGTLIGEFGQSCP